MDTLHKLLIALLIVTYMLQVGLATPAGSFRSVRARTIARGLFVMLVLGPLAALFISRIVTLPPPVTVALVLLSTAGVLPLAARGAHKLHGSTPTAVMLTLILAVIAIFTAAPSTRLLLSYSGHPDRELFHPLKLLVQVVLLQGAPLLLGTLIARTTARASAIERFLAKANLVLLAAVVLVIVVPHLGVLTYVGLRGVAAAALLALVLAALAHYVGGPMAEDRQTIAAIVNKPNVGLALAIATGAGVGRPYVIAIVSLFLVRVLTGAVVDTIRERRASHRHPPMTHGAAGGE